MMTTGRFRRVVFSFSRRRMLRVEIVLEELAVRWQLVFGLIYLIFRLLALVVPCDSDGQVFAMARDFPRDEISAMLKFVQARDERLRNATGRTVEIEASVRTATATTDTTTVRLAVVDVLEVFIYFTGQSNLGRAHGAIDYI